MFYNLKFGILTSLQKNPNLDKDMHGSGGAEMQQETACYQNFNKLSLLDSKQREEVKIKQKKNIPSST